MTQRKFKSYTLWVKWRHVAWTPIATCLNLPCPAENPKDVLKGWFESHYIYNYWVRGKTWMILPEGRKPKDAKSKKRQFPETYMSDGRR